MMYLCLDCGELFEEPKHYTETHGLDFPPYEEWSGCPECAGAYVKTILCDYCEEWITGQYIRLHYDDTVVCEDCYSMHNIESER